MTFGDSHSAHFPRPAVTIKVLLLGIQSLLQNPYPAGARPDVEKLYYSDKSSYEKRLKQEVAKYKKKGAL